MAEKEMVNHPDHYEKGGKHIECIHLMALICEGYSGIAAFDIGQCKYIYRCGCKAEQGMEDKAKAIQDSNKYGWYLNDFRMRALQNRTSSDPEYHRDELLPKGWYCEKPYNDAIANFIADEYTFDKGDLAKPIIRSLITNIYCMRTFGDLDRAIDTVKMLSKVLAE